MTDYRLWVLRHWSIPGWSIVVDRLRTKKGSHEIKMLVRAGLLAADDYGMYRITPAGRLALDQDRQDGRGR